MPSHIDLPKTRKTQRRNYNDIKDRLSDLPDGILLHILSFFDVKEAVQTCILSRRWKNLWKIRHTLTLIPSHFTNYNTFTKFISKYLRNNSSALNVLNLNVGGGGTFTINPQLLERILKYAFSHNLQQLQIQAQCHIHKFFPSLFSCRTLTSIDLSLYNVSPLKGPLFPNSLNLPALTDLSLRSFIFCVNHDGRVDPFSTLYKLNSLTINNCIVRDKKKLCISSATLVKLTMRTDFSSKRKKAIATAGLWRITFCLSTPSLCTFVYFGIPRHKLCGSMSDLSSVKHVTIDVCHKSNSKNTSLSLLNWLVVLANTESLTVSLNTLKVLSLVPDLLKVEFPSLYSLKSLKIIQCLLSSKPKEIVDFLIQNAPSAKVHGGDTRGRRLRDAEVLPRDLNQE